MSSVTKKSPLASSIGQKFLVAATGLFLISFLVVHLSGNLLLLKNDGGEAFNAYAHFMATNPLILAMEVVLFGGFLAHIGLTLLFSNKNSGARPVKYKAYNVDQTSKFASRFMLVSGLIVLTFLILHLLDFFFPYKLFGAEGDPTLYDVSVYKLSQPWRTAIYTVAMVLLGVHLSHGFRSAFQTFGLQMNAKIGKRLDAIGLGIAILLSAGFAFLPLYFTIKSML
jgi:succinate dehydrogenase / fumarate reductase cytochrome b subunit